MTALKVDEEIANIDEEEVAIIEEIVEVLERRHKDKLPAFRDIPNKKLLEETAKIDKVLCKFKTLMNYFMLELLLLQILWE